MQLHHICLFAEDVAHATKFYIRAFGATIWAKWDVVVSSAADLPGEGIFLRLGGGTFVEIFPSDPGVKSDPFPRAGVNHFCLTSNDCEADFKRAIAAGARQYRPARVAERGLPWDGGPMAMRLGDADGPRVMVAYLKGPDGEIIELIQYLDPDAEKDPVGSADPA